MACIQPDAKPITHKTLMQLVLLVLAAATLGWADNWQDLQTKAARLNSLQVDFIQEKHMKMLAQPIRSTGRFYYRRPAAIRWEYSSPLQSVMIMNKGAIKHFVQAENGVEESGQRRDGIG